ncbi:MAG: hypothetical protein IJG82_11340, partial [Atopobiaceae bacterium]|nr:hypothetical protein [Atopobiaceae bacterium]
MKIDCIYLNRSPLMAIERRASTLMPGLRVPLFADAELAGGKVKAFFDRVVKGLDGDVPVFSVEPKIDGFGIELTYQHGTLA